MSGTADRQQLQQRYRGELARHYETERRAEGHWATEHAAAQAMLSRVRAAGAQSLLDIPVGTGRFAEIYEDLGFQLTGLDISEEMLEQAREACRAAGLGNARLEVGDAFDIDLPDKSVDVSLCVRFMQHIDYEGFEKVTAELCRVSRRYLILGIHLIQPDQPALLRVLKAFAAAPTDTVRRVWRGLRKTGARQSPPIDPSASYMTRTDKAEDRVMSHLNKLGLAVVEQREILTSLRPSKAVSYRFLLLELPSA